MSGPIRLGLIGAGRWGRFIIATVQRSKFARLSAVASSNPQTREIVDEHCRLFEDWRDLLICPEIEGVIITVPTSVQPVIAEQAIRRGLPVLLEKPIATSAIEAERLTALAHGAEALVQVDHTDLSNPALVALLEHLPQPSEIVHLSGSWCNRGPFRDDVTGFWDYGAHALAVCLQVMGDDPTSLRAKQLAPAERGDLIEVELRWRHGVAATIVMGNAAASKQRDLKIACRDRLLSFDDLAVHKAVIAERPISYAPELPLDAVLHRFARSLSQKHRSCADLDLGVRVVKLLTALDRVVTG